MNITEQFANRYTVLDHSAICFNHLLFAVKSGVVNENSKQIYREWVDKLEPQDKELAEQFIKEHNLGI